ncbi:hypothetical protein CB1_000779001 [Camelus ferus]|nr:hypothetical protein CB1_000779001 [Camelus ferus]
MGELGWAQRNQNRCVTAAAAAVARVTEAPGLPPGSLALRCNLRVSGLSESPRLGSGAGRVGLEVHGGSPVAADVSEDAEPFLPGRDVLQGRFHCHFFREAFLALPESIAYQSPSPCMFGFLLNRQLPERQAPAVLVLGGPWCEQELTVQEERQRGKDRGENEVESTSSANEDMPVEKILEAELAVEPKTETYVEANVGLNPSSPNDPVTNICQAADKQLFTLVEWAKRIPHFSELPLDDQVILLRAGWNELLIASFSHRSIAVKDGILLATGLHVHRNSAHSAGVGAIFDRCPVSVLFLKGLSNPAEVEALREKVYASLEAYCKHKYPEQPGSSAVGEVL